MSNCAPKIGVIMLNLTLVGLSQIISILVLYVQLTVFI